MPKSTIYLRALEVSDLDRVFQWHNNASLYETLGGVFRPVSRLTEEEWVHKRATYSSTELNLAICILGDDEHIGNIYLRNIDWVSRNGELHIFIGSKNHRNKGYGTASVNWLVNYAFKHLGLVRIYLFALSDNEAAIQMYKRCDFKIEGTLRNHAFKNGSWKDIVLMGLCISDFSEKEYEE